MTTTFVQVGSVWVRADSIYTVAPAETGATVYAGGAAFSCAQTPEDVLSSLEGAHA